MMWQKEDLTKALVKHSESLIEGFPIYQTSQAIFIYVAASKLKRKKLMCYNSIN
jgi:hypothetical protein